jgi:hypothetical protein
MYGEINKYYKFTMMTYTDIPVNDVYTDLTQLISDLDSLKKHIETIQAAQEAAAAKAEHNAAVAKAERNAAAAKVLNNSLDNDSNRGGSRRTKKHKKIRRRTSMQKKSINH